MLNEVAASHEGRQADADAFRFNPAPPTPSVSTSNSISYPWSPERHPSVFPGPDPASRKFLRKPRTRDIKPAVGRPLVVDGRGVTYTRGIRAVLRTGGLSEC